MAKFYIYNALAQNLTDSEPYLILGLRKENLYFAKKWWYLSNLKTNLWPLNFYLKNVFKDEI